MSSCNIYIHKFLFRTRDRERGRSQRGVLPMAHEFVTDQKPPPSTYLFISLMFHQVRKLFLLFRPIMWMYNSSNKLWLLRLAFYCSSDPVSNEHHHIDRNNKIIFRVALDEYIFPALLWQSFMQDEADKFLINLKNNFQIHTFFAPVSLTMKWSKQKERYQAKWKRN